MLCQDLKENIIEEQDFHQLREFYKNRIVESNQILEKKDREMKMLYQKSICNQHFFTEIKNIKT